VLTVEGLVKRYPRTRRDEAGAVAAVDGVSFTVDTGEFFTIVGPSGCGKTTTLRCIAGLERPDAGEIRIEDSVLFSSRSGVDVVPNERGLGMVFQSYAVWPHMDVFANVAFPLTVLPRGRRPARATIAERVERALAAVRLDGLSRRPATDLSSGQQQRVALARALVIEPPLLLLDEPLSNVDAKLREEMRSELVRLQRELGVTTVYVTHDQVEALALSDSVAVMNDGVIEQIGPPQEIYARPASTFVADFVGSSNLLAGTVESSGDEATCVRTAAGSLTAAGGAFSPGQPVIVVVRPEHIGIARAEPGRSPARALNEWRGVVHGIAYLGDAIDYAVHVGESRLKVRTHARDPLPRGTEVVLRLRTADCAVLHAR
jgi:iron(III) transport system ATP-binding protein